MAVKYVIDDETMTRIAEPLRSLAGRTDELTPAEMAAAGNAATSEVNTQSDLIAQISAALEGKVAGGGSGDATGSFTPVENLSNSTKTLEIDVGFQPSAVTVYRKVWAKGTPSINLSFVGDFCFSVCSTSGSSKAAEKLMGGSYAEITDTGFTVIGNTTYYWVGGTEYGYVAWK